MERLANYQQMVDPTMVWGQSKVTMRSEWMYRSLGKGRMADPCSLSDSGRIGSGCGS